MKGLSIILASEKYGVFENDTGLQAYDFIVSLHSY
jgi:hypothetical protein